MSDKDYSVEEITPIALEKAIRAFQECLSDEGYEGAYWDVRFTAWTLGVNNFKRIKKYEIESEVKDAQRARH